MDGLVSVIISSLGGWGHTFANEGLRSLFVAISESIIKERLLPVFCGVPKRLFVEVIPREFSQSNRKE